MTRFLLALLFVVATLPASAQPKKDPPKEEMTDAEKRVRAIAELKLGARQYLFETVADRIILPPIDFENPAKARELLGKYVIRWSGTFDAEGAVLARPSGFIGPRFTTVDVRAGDGTAFNRSFTWYAAGKPAADWKFNPQAPGELAKWSAVDEKVVATHAKLVADVFKDRTYAQFSTDPRVARLLAGLFLSDVKVADSRKSTDPFAVERQWWVAHRREFNRLAEKFPKPFAAPDKLDKPAPVVREGTLAEAGMKPDAAKNIDAVLTEWAGKDEQAFAVCIVRNGVIVLHKAYGTRDGRPMTTGTKSWMASITKTMSASCMMMLVDRGLVGLDEPIDKYLPALALRGIKVEKPLTVRHCYTHTGGLSKWPAEWYNDELPDVEERVALAYPLLKVGKEWAYNGQSYTLAGKVIENVSGEAMPLFYKKHLLDPLSMTNTDVTGTHADAQSVPLDIAKFGQMLLNKGSYGNHRFFKEQTFAKMLPKKLTDVLGPEATKTFGLGLDGSAEKIGHGAASGATFHVDRTENLVVVMTRNKYGTVQDKYNGKFWEAIRNGMEKPGKK